MHLSGAIQQAIGLYESPNQGRSWAGDKYVGVTAAETVFKGKGRRWNPEGFQTLVTYRNRSQKSSRENRTVIEAKQRVSEGRSN